MATTLPEAPPPPIVGDYHVQSFVGRGGQADVYAVSCGLSGERRALKLQSRSGSRRAGERFKREFQLLNSFDHPALPQVYDFGRLDDGRYYIVLELLAGMSMRRWAHSLGPPGTAHRTARVLGTLAQVADLLRVIHAPGLIHGDIKPSNLVIRPGGGVHVLDLGGARLRDVPTPWFEEGVYFGTPPYTAPEQWEGTGVGPAADLYSLGVAAYALLCGHNPFAGEREVARELHKTLVPPALSDVPDAVARCVQTLLAKDPAERPDAATVEACFAAHGSAPIPELPPPRALSANTALWDRLRGMVADCPSGVARVVTGPALADCRLLLERVALTAAPTTHVATLWGARVHPAAADAAIDAAYDAARRGPAIVFADRLGRLPARSRERLLAALATARRKRRPLACIAAVAQAAGLGLELGWRRIPRAVCVPSAAARRTARDYVAPRVPAGVWDESYRRGELEAASQALAAALDAGAGAGAEALLAELRAAAGRTSEALAGLRSALERAIAPTDRARLFVALAACDLDLHRYDAATANLESARAAAPGIASDADWLRVAAQRVSATFSRAPALVADIARALDGMKPSPARARLAAWHAELLSANDEHRAAKRTIDAAVASLRGVHLPWLAEAAALRVRIYARFGVVDLPPPEVETWLRSGAALGLAVTLSRALADAPCSDGEAAETSAWADIRRVLALSARHERRLLLLVPWVARADNRYRGRPA